MPIAKHSVLIVDDEADVLLSLTGLLRREFKVFTANSGAEALEIMNEHEIHVVMTDQRMPTMTGVELMQQLRNEHPEAVRIVFTGYADTRAVIDAINNGELYRYLTKPWDPDDLIEVLHQATAKHDELVAQAKLRNEMEGYLNDAAHLASQANPEDVGAEFLTEFNSKTEQLQNCLQRSGDG